MWHSIASYISQVTRQAFQISDRRSVGGGSINQAYWVSNGSLAYFVKLNQASHLAMFETEAFALRQMAASQTIRVPQPLCYGIAENFAYIVLEWIDLGSGNASSWENLGRNLAAMHQIKGDRGFGWFHDNVIGATPQKNSWTATWAEFFTQQRLGYQFQLAERRGGHFPQQQKLLATVPELLAGHHPYPSLVHGDLWSGNAAVTQQGEPIIFDPAAYYGDREVDLAMTELFGGFPASFYSGYSQVLAIDPGYRHRKTLYNLYHILNHFNLFGGSYAAQANQMIATLL
ncbi:MAG TPA: fructosamine kinase family protein [Coleofasciculaceae cyanobacterium]|jgi:fructosamine-3-kinase